MPHLLDIFPDPDLLIALAPEDLAVPILQIVLDSGQRHPQALFQQVHGRHHGDQRAYPQNKKREAENALNAGWHWLLRQGLLIPEAGSNGENGYCQVSERGKGIAANGNIEAFQQAASFPKTLLHPQIADRVWICLARGEPDTAVFEALRAVEIAVRGAGGYANTDIGVELMRNAFHKDNGPLTDVRQPEQERLALSHLFAGALGYYKNPQSHRVANVDIATAREVAVLASHLLRIVDERSP